VDGPSIQRDDASSGQAVQEAAYGAFDGGRIIALVSIEQAMRDQAVYVGRAYLKDHASISTLTALPETRHTKSPGPCTGPKLYHRAGWLQAAAWTRFFLFLIRYHFHRARTRHTGRIFTNDYIRGEDKRTRRTDRILLLYIPLRSIVALTRSVDFKPIDGGANKLGCPARSGFVGPIAAANAIWNLIGLKICESISA